MAGSNEAGFRLGGAGRARERPDCRCEANKVEAFALESLGGTSEPILHRALGAALERHLDEARIAPMQAAQQVHRIGKIAAGMSAGSFEQGIEMRMASTAVARDTRELGFGDADLNLAHGPIDCHSSPLVLHSGEA
jgi:hypothetical protein